MIVHCHAGVSRSATIVTAFVMWKCGLRFPEAFALVRSGHPASCPNGGFEQQLKDYQCSLVFFTQFPEDDGRAFRCFCGAFLFSKEDIVHHEEGCDGYFVNTAKWMECEDEGLVRCYLCRKNIGCPSSETGKMCGCGQLVSDASWISAQFSVGD